MQKVWSIVVMCTFVLLLVPPVRANIQQENRIGPCPTCNPSGLDQTYLAVNTSVKTVWNKTIGTTARPPASDLISIQTAQSIGFSHAQYVGHNALADANKPLVQNLAVYLSNPSTTFVAAVQKAMKSYNGMTVSSSAVVNMLKGEVVHLPTLIAMYNAGGIESVEKYANTNLQGAISLAMTNDSRGFTYADYRPGMGRLRLVEDGAPTFLGVLAVVEGFLVALFTALYVFAGCAECDGGAAAAGLIGATAALLEYFGIDGSSWGSGPWVDGGGDCDPCD